MAIQQMGLMHYRAPPAGGADSAYLEIGPFDGGTSTTSAAITFNPTGSGYGYVTFYSSAIPTTFVWKTGPNPASDYQVIYNETFSSGVFMIEGPVGTWENLNLTDAPIYSLAAGGSPSRSTGYLAIRNANEPGVELANVFLDIITNGAG